MSEGRGDKMKIGLGGLGLVSGTVSNSVTVHNGPHALSTVQIPSPEEEESWLHLSGHSL